MSREFQGLRVDNVHVGRRNGENNTVGLGDVLGDKGPGLLLDIGGLISNGNLSQTFQVSPRFSIEC